MSCIAIASSNHHILGRIRYSYLDMLLGLVLVLVDAFCGDLIGRLTFSCSHTCRAVSTSCHAQHTQAYFAEQQMDACSAAIWHTKGTLFIHAYVLDSPHDGLHTHSPQHSKWLRGGLT